MAAAAALSRSRGVAGVRATNGLFLVFTLLCLVCLSSSLTKKDELKEDKEKIEKELHLLNMKKAELAASSELMNYYVNIMDQLMGLVKTTSTSTTADFPPLEGLMGTIKDYVEKVNTWVDGKNEELGEKIEKYEQTLTIIKKLINSIEEQEAEL